MGVVANLSGYRTQATGERRLSIREKIAKVVGKGEAKREGSEGDLSGAYNGRKEERG